MTLALWPQWNVGRVAVREVFAMVWSELRFGTVWTAANGQPALAMYARGRGEGNWEAHAIQVLSFRGDAVAAMTTFRDRRLFARFGLPEVLGR